MTSTSTWTARERRAAAGLLALTSLEGFEALAVVTAMPAVARDLHAVGSIALAFAVPLAVSVLARSAAGDAMDRRGPAPGVRLGVALFLVGLVGAAVAPSMPVFLLARALQGAGTGLTGVGLYVVVSREFDPAHRQRMLVLLTTAWILPALVGPAIAGLVTERFGWHWVFAGVVPLVVIAYALVHPSLAASPGPTRLDDHAGIPRGRGNRPLIGRRALGWSALASTGLLAASCAGQVSGHRHGSAPTGGSGDLGLAGPVVLVAAVVAVLVGASRLVPRGTWTGRRGLPATLGARSLSAAAFVGADAYLPLALHDRHGMSLAAAGAVITASALAWTGAAWVGDHARLLAPPRRRVRLGTALTLVGTLGVLVAVGPAVPVAVIAVLWTLGGAGMGLATPTSAALVLDLSPDGEHGVMSAAMQTNDVVAQVLVLAVGAMVFTRILGHASTVAFGLVAGLSVAAACASLALTSRLGGARPPRGTRERGPAGCTASPSVVEA